MAEGGPPIVFTSGSWMSVGRRFFEASAEACRRLGRRGVLLTPNREEVPEGLPEGVAHFEFVPFSYLLPRAAAIVHTGGIGTGYWFEYTPAGGAGSSRAFSGIGDSLVAMLPFCSSSPGLQQSKLIDTKTAIAARTAA